jgi:hypothetical protein
MLPASGKNIFLLQSQKNWECSLFFVYANLYNATKNAACWFKFGCLQAKLALK